ncbi:MAG: 4-hydroxy-tetrahydrodipicolinate reductase [Holosporaceae bacterium]|jgi:4-hydroxy-tetrahydrodipicolinate reductase|nr:4-hydroxy-tetrahydrodipicolinate reductase [Holosporaceae bacterium]
MIAVGVIGITGRMGKILVDSIESNDELTLSGGISSQNIGKDLEKIVKCSDVIVDFSHHTAVLAAAKVAANHAVPLISGTTGLSANDFLQLRQCSQRIPLLYAANFSIGIQLIAAFIRRCAGVLKNFDFSILDKHHRHKKDAPSGTALFLAQQYEEIAKKSPQIVSLRCGNNFGEHVCDFCGEDETITVTHSVLNKRVFAVGALRCARWIVGKDPGFYGICDAIDFQ